MASVSYRPLLEILEARFTRHPERHAGVAWADIAARLERRTEALRTLQQMEETGGEPDVVVLAPGALAFVDCAAESPAGRRSVCYDGEARRARKEHAPATSATEMAEAMGAALLTEAEYHALQQCGAFDRKTSSWLATPDDVRALGGALFGDRRYGRVFVYHNGAQSYYAARGFRVVLRLPSVCPS